MESYCAVSVWVYLWVNWTQRDGLCQITFFATLSCFRNLLSALLVFLLISRLWWSDLTSTPWKTDERPALERWISGPRETVDKPLLLLIRGHHLRYQGRNVTKHSVLWLQDGSILEPQWIRFWHHSWCMSISDEGNWIVVKDKPNFLPP